MTANTHHKPPRASQKRISLSQSFAARGSVHICSEASRWKQEAGWDGGAGRAGEPVGRRERAGEGRRGGGFRDQAPKSTSTTVCLMCKQHATAADGSVTAQPCDKSSPSYLESCVSCVMVNGPLTHLLKWPLRRPKSLCHHVWWCFPSPSGHGHCCNLSKWPSCPIPPQHSSTAFQKLLTCPSPDTKEQVLA